MHPHLINTAVFVFSMIPNTNLHDSGMRIGVNTTRPIWENISQVKIFQSPRYLL